MGLHRGRSAEWHLATTTQGLLALGGGAFVLAGVAGLLLAKLTFTDSRFRTTAVGTISISPVGGKSLLDSQQHGPARTGLRGVFANLKP